MKRLTSLIPVLFILGVLMINPFLAPTFSVIGRATTIITTSNANSKAPPLPQGASDWIDVSLETQYFYNDTATITWYGRPRTGAKSPFNPLYTWTKAGSIEGGIWDGNPGNATITAEAWDNETTAAEVRNFLNYTMENYVRYTSWPSLSSFNFTQYENATSWVFNDVITSHEEFLNNTFFHVNNASGYLMDGFNATGLTDAIIEYRIYLEWYEADPIAEVTFSYRIPNATEQIDDTYIFSLGRAMGRSTPLTLAGTGRLTVTAPYNRMLVNGTPVEVFENVTFPYFPVKEEVYIFDETTRDWDYMIWYRQPVSTLSISRVFVKDLVRSSTVPTLIRGEQITVEVTVSNTGDVPFSEVVIGDVQAIEDGIFQLISGFASTTVTDLQPGENVTLEYTVMALVASTYEYPLVTAIGIDLFSSQYIFTSTSFSMTISNGLLPSEVLLIEIVILVIIILVVILLLYRFRRRIF